MNCIESSHSFIANNDFLHINGAITVLSQQLQDIEHGRFRLTCAKETELPEP